MPDCCLEPSGSGTYLKRNPVAFEFDQAGDGSFGKDSFRQTMHRLSAEVVERLAPRALHTACIHRTSFGDESCGKPFEFADDGAELPDLRVGFVLGSAGHDTDQDELLADVDVGASFNNRFNHLLLQCGQAAGGDVGILFY